AAPNQPTPASVMQASGLQRSRKPPAADGAEHTGPLAEPRLLRRGAEMREAAFGVNQRRGFGPGLLRLHNQPAAITGRRERHQHRGELDRAVARLGENAVENGIEKTAVVVARLSEHLGPDILAVDVNDAAAVAASDHGGVDTGKDEMPRVEEQPHAVA